MVPTQTMSLKRFDWDAYFSRVSFKELKHNAPEFQTGRRNPSCLSPDGAWIYCSSVDGDAETSSAEALRALLHEVVDAYHSAAPNDHWRRFIATVDCRALCGRLSDVDDDAVYAHPDELLRLGSRPE